MEISQALWATLQSQNPYVMVSGKFVMHSWHLSSIAMISLALRELIVIALCQINQMKSLFFLLRILDISPFQYKPRWDNAMSFGNNWPRWRILCLQHVPSCGKSVTTEVFSSISLQPCGVHAQFVYLANAYINIGLPNNYVDGANFDQPKSSCFNGDVKFDWCLHIHDASVDWDLEAIEDLWGNWSPHEHSSRIRQKSRLLWKIITDGHPDLHFQSNQSTDQHGNSILCCWRSFFHWLGKELIMVSMMCTSLWSNLNL